jgi:hypothetical protein
LYLVATDLASLNTRPKANYRKNTAWPPGKPQRLTRAVAKRIFDAISTSTDSLLGVLQANPDLPPHRQIFNWRTEVPWFAEGFRVARREQAEFLVQHCIDLAKGTNPTNAHSQRVKYDIYKWIAGKFSPDVYGDKPATTAVNVAVGFNVSPERLNEIRGKLDVTRTAYSKPLTLSNPVTSNGNRLPTSETEIIPLQTESSTHGNNHD